MYLEESIEKVNKKLHVLYSKKNIAIWGAAENTVRLFQYTDISKYNIEVIVDNGKCGSTFWGKRVIAPREVDWNNVDAVVISAFYKENEIYDELIEKYLFRGTIIKLNWEGQEKPFYKHLMKTELQVPLEYRHIIEDNVKFHNTHQGKRCFILCTGPSVKLLDLKKLRGEYSIAVSNFYLHEDYNIIKPTYYCIPGFTYDNLFTREIGKKHLEKVEQKAGDIQFFYSVTEKETIEKNGMYQGKRVNYLYFAAIGQEYEEVDLTLKTMNVQSVSIMCLELAIYMGFKEIYLIGTEHDELRMGRYDYFYDRKDSVTGYTDKSIGVNGDSLSSYGYCLGCNFRLWEQYKIMKKIAAQKGTNIYNATRGGQLDLFERVDYDTLF